MLVSASRDKTLLKWDLTRHQGEEYGRPRLLMRGHSNFVQVPPCPPLPPSLALATGLWFRF